MTPEQREEFEAQGLTRLRGAVDPEVAGAIRDRVWQRTAEKLGICRDDPATWQRVKPRVVKELKAAEGLFDPMLGPPVREALDALLGSGGWTAPAPVGQLIMTPPHAGEWALPHTGWHMDHPAPGWVDADADPPVVQLFLLLDRLEPHAGGTLVVGGSHRLIRNLPERESRDFAGHSAQIKQALRRRVPFLRELAQPGPNAERVERFVEHGTEHEGVPLRVLELTGERGDVYLMHGWCLHAASMNTSGRMRMMVTERLPRKGVRLYSWNRER